MQKYIGIVACLCCLAYAGLLGVASFEWIQTLMNAGIGAEDLGHFGIMQWHIGLIVPLGFALVFIRFAEILVRILRNRQTGLGLADEAADVLKLTEQEDDKP
ncbi:Tripartite ATP-independent periplasmic transporter, DctQ component [compost metagenome]